MIKNYNTKEITKYSGIEDEYFRVLISNTSKLKDNVHSFVKGITASGEIIIDGYYRVLPTEYFVIGEEIVKIISHTFNSVVKETQLKVERACLGSPLTTFLQGDLVDSVIDVTLEVEQYNYSSKMDISNNPFLVGFGTSNVKLKTKVQKWNKFSKKGVYNYNNYKTKVFIFEGYNKKCILTSTGFLKKLNSTNNNSDRQSITLNCVDQLGTYWDKDIKNKTHMKNKTVEEALAQILEIPKEKIYFKHIDKSKYPIIDLFTLYEYSTYKELFEIFSSNGIRFFFTPKGHLHIFSEVLDNKSLVANRNLTDVKNLTTINLTNDSQLVFNYFDITQRKRFPLYELDKGFNYKYSKRFSNINFLYKDANNNYLIREITIQDTDIPPKISLDEHGKPSVIMLKEVNSGLEFICNPIEIYANQFTLVPISIYNDTGLLDFGKGKYLESLGFLGNLTFDLYYVNGNLPIVFSLNKSEEKGLNARTNNLEIPISPVILNTDGTIFRDLNKEYAIQFGSPQNLKDLTYTGEYVGVDNLKGTWVGGTDLLWTKEWEQSQRGLDIFVNTTRTTDRNLCVELPVYDKFDNSGFKLDIVQKVNDRNIKGKFYNTIKKDIKLNLIENIEFARNEIIGDIGVKTKNNLRPHDLLFPIELLPGHDEYEKTKFDEAVAGGIEIVVNSRTVYNGDDIIVLNNPIFPNIRYGIIRLEHLVYIQNFFIRLNPIVEQTSELNYINYPSVEEYDGRKEFSLNYTLFNEKYTKNLIYYLNSAYAGTSMESIKYVVPINTVKDLDLELYDLVSITDNTITDIQSNWLFIIVGKAVTKNPTRNLEYTLLNLYTGEVEIIDLKVAEVQTFNPLEEPTYQHSGIEQEEIEVDEYETRIQIVDSRRGKLVGQIINPEDFVFKSVVGAESPAFEVEISGKLKSQYITEYFPDELYKSFLIFKIQKEYVYGCGFSYTDSSGDTKYRIQLLTRRLGNSPMVLNLSSQKIIAYKIVEGSTKQYGLSTSSIYVGNGTDSGYMSFNPVEGLNMKAKSIVMTTGEPVATQNDITNTNKDLTDLINNRYNSSITYSDSKFEINKNSIDLLNKTVVNQGGDIITLNSQLLVQQGNISSIVQEQKDIKGSITTTNSRIDQTTNELQLSINNVEENGVRKDKVLSAIALSNEDIRIWGDKLSIDSRTIFNADVQLNGNITGDRGIVTITPDGKKQTIIRGGEIHFIETNSYGQQVPTRAIRKMATGVYNFNPHAIQWVDVRSYTSRVDWNNVNVVSGLSSANFQTNTRLIKCEVIRHPADKHLFYIRVGGSYLQENAMGLWGSDSVSSQSPTRDVYYRGFGGVSSFRVEYTATSFYTTYLSVSLWYGTYNYEKTERTRYHRCWYRYKPSGTGNWTGWILGSSAELDPSLTGQLYDVEVRIECYHEAVLVQNASGHTNPTNTTPYNIQVNFYASNKSITAIEGGSAYWYAYEE